MGFYHMMFLHQLKQIPCLKQVLIRGAIFILIALGFVGSVSAETLFGIVSRANAPELVNGAHQFLADHPKHKLVLRTTKQIMEMPADELKKHVQQADIVFVGGVFGSVAEQLIRQELQKKRQQNSRHPGLFIALHSDRRLVKLSHAFGKKLLSGADLSELMSHPPVDSDVSAWWSNHLSTHKAYREWLMAKAFWTGRDSHNMVGLLKHLFSSLDNSIEVPPLVATEPLRAYYEGQFIRPDQLKLAKDKPWVVLLDYDSGERPGEKQLLDQLCLELEKQNIGCFSLLASWGEASVLAIQSLVSKEKNIKGIIALQNFVIGGGEGREVVNTLLAKLDVPVFKGIRLTEASREQWQLSEEGLSWDSVHYRVAMPELQGIAQPMVVAAMTAPSIDRLTGVELALSEPISEQVFSLTQRVQRWLTLQTKANKDKKIAIIYYNHPPGRHNVGADNLNVPESLWDMLNTLQKSGYHTGPLPESAEALLDQIQQRGINLPEDRGALSAMESEVVNVSQKEYQSWFETLPAELQREMVEGPLGYLHAMLQKALSLEDRTIGQRLLKRVVEDLRHALVGAEHPARDRVLALLEQLEKTYSDAFKGNVDWKAAEQLVTAIAKAGVEGVRGWGDAPGKVMVSNGKILLPGLQFGNIFIGPQPPRGWELNEELLHANLSFPPPHQYLAFYQWLRFNFKADALVHLGRHSTYEFLPRHRVGLSEQDYPTAVLGDLPSIYPYIVDGVGEGIQAKRRGLAVMIDHLTPPLSSTELYDRLLELRQLVESYEAAPDTASAVKQRAIDAIKKLVDELKLGDELTASMSGELAVRGVTEFDQVDDELLVHEVGHYLTKLQEDFMPLGLHVFGRDWSKQAIDTMLESMASAGQVSPTWKQNLSSSPKAEMRSLLRGLEGRYTLPGKGNDPIRTPEALPTGKNFYALDGSLLPSRLGHEIGTELARKARVEESNMLSSNQTSLDESGMGKKSIDKISNSQNKNTEAIVLWASDAVRDEGAMISFGLDMLGLAPVWNSRGIVKSLERLPMAGLEENGQQRRRHDVVFTTSGLFRDLYGAQLVWLERAVLMALDASSEQIHKDYPALTLALNHALEPLGALSNPGDEPLSMNLVAAQWVKDARLALQNGIAPTQAGKQATYRVFGAPPGAYGAGVNRMVERSGSWEQRSEVGQVYLHRMGHAYGENLAGEPLQGLFAERLKTVGKTYLGRASNLYGLLDNNDSFDYLGGLSLAIETVSGQPPQSFIVAHPDNVNLTVEPLDVALLQELRGQFLNPQWLKPLMDEGYAGARTMGSEFLEYLWGWQVTNPGVVKSWVWDEVKSVYVDDSLDLGLDEFLEKDHNVHVKSNMLSIMLVAAQKEFWETDQQTLTELANQFAGLILTNGLPGSGHTNPNHPLYDWLEDYVSAEKYGQLQQVLDSARVEKSVQSVPSVIAEITLDSEPQADTSDTDNQSDKLVSSEAIIAKYWQWLLVFVLLLGLGWYRGMARPGASSRLNTTSEN